LRNKSFVFYRFLVVFLGGPYEIFSGRDASRGLAKQSFEEDMLTSLDEPIDDLADLTKQEWDNLLGWESGFDRFCSAFCEFELMTVLERRGYRSFPNEILPMRVSSEIFFRLLSRLWSMTDTFLYFMSTRDYVESK